MESAPPSRVFSVREMIIEAEDGPESSAHSSSEPEQQSDAALCRIDASTLRLKNCQKQKDAIFTSMKNAEIEEEDCNIVFEVCNVSMDTDNSGQDQPEKNTSNTSSDPLKQEKMLKKASFTEVNTSTKKKPVAPDEFSSIRNQLSEPKEEMKVLNQQSFLSHINMRNEDTDDLCLPTLEEPDDILGVNRNFVQHASASRRVRKPTQVSTYSNMEPNTVDSRDKLLRDVQSQKKEVMDS